MGLFGVGVRVRSGCQRRRRRNSRGVTMVEFALVSPVAFLLLLGIVLLGVIVMNQIRLTNIARDDARAVGLCGSLGSGNGETLPDTPTLACSDANVTTFLKDSFKSVDSTFAWAPTWKITKQDGTAPSGGSNSLSDCSLGNLVVVSVTYQQQLYIPLVANFFATSGTTRALTATAEAQCES